MNNAIKIVSFERKKGNKTDIAFLNKEASDKALGFHSSFDVYSKTPLVHMQNTAKILGLSDIYVKDESYRFGLNAFKVLGGSFAIGNYIAKRLGKDISQLDYKKMISNEVKAELGELTFVTATDGNHGRGVAWTANKLGQKSVVYMPKGSAEERLNNIKAEGADASITDLNYDEAVRLANSKAEALGWVMVQDTAWEGYEDIPTWIMQGYTSMSNEALTQLGKEKPTHIFLQAGVGSLAGAVCGFFSSIYGEDRPIITIVEPDKADCLYKTAEANDDKLHFVTGQMNTIMAGLACGEPCTIAWNVLRDYADNFISCPDYIAAKGMRIMGNPAIGDERVISGESGAVTFGLVAEVMLNPDFAHIKTALKLDEKSKVLFFSTEGDTDKKNYLDIVWNGK